MCSNGPARLGSAGKREALLIMCSPISSHCQFLTAHAAQSDLATMVAHGIPSALVCVCDCLLVCVLFVSLWCVCIVLLCRFVMVLCVCVVIVARFCFVFWFCVNVCCWWYCCCVVVFCVLLMTVFVSLSCCCALGCLCS